MTAIGWLLVIALVVCAALLAMKIVPIYLDGFSVGSVVRDLGDDPEMGSLPISEIKKRLLKRLSINMVSVVDGEDIYITPAQGGYQVELEYEVRENIVGNLDIVVDFNFDTVISKK